MSARIASSQATEDVGRFIAATTALTGVLDRGELVRVVVEQLMAAVDADAVALYVFDEGSETFSLLASTGWPDDAVGLLASFPLSADLPATEAVKQGTPVFIGSREEMAERFPDLVEAQERSGTDAWAVLPLLVKNSAVGVLRFSYRSERRFTPERMGLLSAVGRQCALALEAVRLHESEAAARGRADQLLRIAEVAQTARSLDELLAEMLEPLRDMTGADRAVVFLRNEAGHLEVRGASGLTREEAENAIVPWGAGIAGKTAAAGIARVVSDVSSAGPVSTYLSAGGSLIQVPLHAELDESVGVLEVSSKRVDAFEESQVAVLALAAERLSLAIERATAHEVLTVAREQAEGLLRIAEVALAATSLEDLLWAMLEPLYQATGADRAVVFLRDEQSGDLTLRAAVGPNADEAAGVVVPWGKGIAGTIASTGTARVVADLVAAGPVSAYLRTGGSLIGVPLRAEGEHGEVIGVLEVSSKRADAFAESQVAVLTLAAERLSVAIERAASHDRHRHISITLQRSMLPRDLPEIPGCAVSARYLPGAVGTEVGGDWYDAFELSKGAIALTVGDVMGKGVEAAATMAQLRTALRVFALDGLKPSSLVSRLNSFAASSGSDFATMVYGVIDPATTLRYTCAGHPPPLLVSSSGKARYLEAGHGLLLGAEKRAQYRQASVELEEGDTLILYTDGLVESRQQSLDQRLTRLATASAVESADPGQLLDRILQEMAQLEPFSDDVAVLAVRRGD
jgi:serine phosphatase RsbU (regulator of sigma subunit)